MVNGGGNRPSPTALMKIKQLINQLQQYDEEATVVIWVGNEFTKAKEVTPASQVYYEPDNKGNIVSKPKQYVEIK